MTLRQMSQHTGIPRQTVHRILKDLQFSKITPKFIPRILTEDQCRIRVQISNKHLQEIQHNPAVLQRIVTTDESWVFTFDPRTKICDMQWTHVEANRPVKALRSRSQKKTMLVLFMDWNGVISMQFVDRGTAINSEVYISLLCKFREDLRWKRPDLWTNGFQFLQDNGPAHVSAQTLDYFHTVGMSEILWDHPLYSPDLAPCDFWAFSKLKKEIKGHRFQSLDDLKTAVARSLRSIPKANFEDCFKKLQHQYEQCVEMEGEYFEGVRRCD